MTDNTATESLLACVVDVVAKSPTSPIDKESVDTAMSRYGPITRIIPWKSVSQNRHHFYVQYKAASDCERARAADIPGLIASGINRDPAHRSRFFGFIQPATRPQSSSSSKAVRHAPYDSSHSPHAIRLRRDIPPSDDSSFTMTGPRSSLPARPSFDYSPRATAKRPAGVSQTGSIRFQPPTAPISTDILAAVESAFKNHWKETPDGRHASSRDPPLSRTDLPAHLTTPPNTHAVIRLPLTPKSQTPSPPQPVTVLPSKSKLDILLHGEIVSVSADDDSAAQSIVAMLDADNASPDQWARTALHVAQQGYQATAEEIKRRAPPGTRCQPDPSSQVKIEEAIKRLTEINAQNTNMEGPHPNESDRSLLSQFAVDPRFDIKSHITSGRFLQADSTTPVTPFKISPLHAYFADVYSKLQTELQASKERCLELEHNYELEQVLRKRVRAELRVEMSLRKGCELQLNAAETRLNEERAKVATVEAARHQDNLALNKVRQELKETKELLGKIDLLLHHDKRVAVPAIH